MYNLCPRGAFFFFKKKKRSLLPRWGAGRSKNIAGMACNNRGFEFTVVSEPEPEPEAHDLRIEQFDL
jgi:hypothetical protein